MLSTTLQISLMGLPLITINYHTKQYIFHNDFSWLIYHDVMNFLIITSIYRDITLPLVTRTLYF